VAAPLLRMLPATLTRLLVERYVDATLCQEIERHGARDLYFLPLGTYCLEIKRNHDARPWQNQFGSGEPVDNYRRWLNEGSQKLRGVVRRNGLPIEFNRALCAWLTKTSRRITTKSLSCLDIFKEEGVLLQGKRAADSRCTVTCARPFAGSRSRHKRHIAARERAAFVVEDAQARDAFPGTPVEE